MAASLRVVGRSDTCHGPRKLAKGTSSSAAVRSPVVAATITPAVFYIIPKISVLRAGVRGRIECNEVAFADVNIKYFLLMVLCSAHTLNNCCLTIAGPRLPKMKISYIFGCE